MATVSDKIIKLAEDTWKKGGSWSKVGFRRVLQVPLYGIAALVVSAIESAAVMVATVPAVLIYPFNQQPLKSVFDAMIISPANIIIAAAMVAQAPFSAIYCTVKAISGDNRRPNMIAPASAPAVPVRGDAGQVRTAVASYPVGVPREGSAAANPAEDTGAHSEDSICTLVDVPSDIYDLFDLGNDASAAVPAGLPMKSYPHQPQRKKQPTTTTEDDLRREREQLAQAEKRRHHQEKRGDQPIPSIPADAPATTPTPAAAPATTPTPAAASGNVVTKIKVQQARGGAEQGV